VKKLIILILLPAMLLSSCVPESGVPNVDTQVSPSTATSSQTAMSIATETASPDITVDPTIIPTIAFTASAPATCQLSPVIPAIDYPRQVQCSFIQRDRPRVRPGFAKGHHSFLLQFSKPRV